MDELKKEVSMVSTGGMLLLQKASYTFCEKRLIASYTL
jgi:hypothetical protein